MSENKPKYTIEFNSFLSKSIIVLTITSLVSAIVMHRFHIEVDGQTITSLISLVIAGGAGFASAYVVVIISDDSNSIAQRQLNIELQRKKEEEQQHYRDAIDALLEIYVETLQTFSKSEDLENEKQSIIQRISKDTNKTFEEVIALINIEDNDFIKSIEIKNPGAIPRALALHSSITSIIHEARRKIFFKATHVKLKLAFSCDQSDAEKLLQSFIEINDKPSKFLDWEHNPKKQQARTTEEGISIELMHRDEDNILNALVIVIKKLIQFEKVSRQEQNK